MISTFSADNFHEICDTLAAKDKDLQDIIARYGYPPLWSRPNSFETLVHIILEQQVSLASAKAALEKLKEKTGGISPTEVMQLSDEEMKACYVSRQKTIYLRHLAEAIIKKRLKLDEMPARTDDAIRQEFIKLKGIGHWTIDVYLMFVLQRADIFPFGDLAAVNALKEVKSLPKDTPKESLIEITETWQPYRTIATMLLWHYYLSVRKKNII